MNAPSISRRARWREFGSSALRPDGVVFVGNLARSACAFGITLVAARLLGPAEFGHFSTFLVYTIFAYTLIGEGFDPGVVRLYAAARERGREAVQEVLGSALVLRGLLAVPMLALCWAAAAWWLPPALASLAQVAAVAALAASLAALVLAAIQADERFLIYAWLVPLPNLLRLAALPVLWLLGKLNLTALMWSYVVALALTAALGVRQHREPWRGLRFGRTTLRELFRFGIWSSLATACFVLTTFLAVPWITHVKGATAGGIYSAAATLLMVIDQYTAALLTTRMAATSRIHTIAGLREYVRQLRPRLLLTAAALCLLFPFAGALVTLVFGAPYAEAGKVMRALLPGLIATLLSHPLYLVFYALNQPQRYTLSGCIALVVFVTLAAWWLPALGIVGVAWAGSVARVIQALGIVIMVITVLRHAPPPTHAPSGHAPPPC